MSEFCLVMNAPFVINATKNKVDHILKGVYPIIRGVGEGGDQLTTGLPRLVSLAAPFYLV